MLGAIANGQDSTYEFEKRRNVPVRYDRELVATTLKAMERVSEIRQKRERAFWKNRYVVAINALVLLWSVQALQAILSLAVGWGPDKQ